MATPLSPWIRNVFGAKEPWIENALFQAGSTQAIVMGEILEFTGNTNTAFVPIDGDYDMATPHDLAIAACNINAGDLAGYYPVIIPRPGDLFKFPLAAAGANAFGTALYYSSSQALTITAGTNIIAYTAGFDNYPKEQGHMSRGDVADRGVTLRTVPEALVAFPWPVSYGARAIMLS